MIDLAKIVEFVVSNWPNIVPFATVFLGWGLHRWLAPKVRLRYGRANNSFHKLVVDVDGNEAGIYCEKHYVQNVGSKPATDVEVVFSTTPTGISTYPALKYTTGVNPEGAFLVEIPKIPPKELIVIDTIHVNSETAELKSVRSNETTGKLLRFVVQRQFGWKMQTLVAIVMLAGLYSLVFWTIQLVLFVLGV